MILTRYLPRLRLPIVAVMFIAVTFGSVRSQDVLEPTTPDLRSVLQLLYERRHDEALKLAERVVKDNELNAEAWYFLGVVHIQRSDFDKASHAFENAIKIRPDLAAEAHSRLAFALLLRNRLPAAEHAARKALEADPKKVLALYTLGVANLRDQKRDEALKNADAVIALKSDFAPAYLLKSEVSMMLTLAERSPNADETKRKERLRYREATGALERYIKLLSAEQATFWREQLETLELYASDEPAQVYSGRDVTGKARLYSKPEPSYTEDARQDGIQGTVILRCVFAADGTINRILVLQSLPGGLTEASVRAAKGIKFAPATINGTPVSMYMQLEYNFNLY